MFAFYLGLLNREFTGGGKRLGWREEKNNKQATFILVQNSCARGYRTDALHQVYIETRAALDTPLNKNIIC